MIDPQENRKIQKIALLVAISCVLQISESLIPHPIPGLRLGLANMVTLIALVRLGFGYALQIAIFRTILSSVIMGTFMSPTFILSFSAAVTSTLVMGLFFWLSSFHRVYQSSIIGISIIGALCHNVVQLYLAYLLLVKHEGIFVFLPWLGIGGVVMGWVTGAVAVSVCRKLEEVHSQERSHERTQQEVSVPVSGHYQAGVSFLHRLPAEIKVMGMFLLSLVILIFNQFWVYVGLFSSLALMVLFSRTSPRFLVLRVRRYGSLVLVAFLLPLFFNSGTHVLSAIGSFKITYEGVSTGTLFALRILFLILLSALLVRTTSPKEMTQGLARLLSPLRHLGFSEKRIAAILALSWEAIPSVWERTRGAIRGAGLKKAMKLRNIIPLLSGVITSLYLDAESKSEVKKGLYAEGERDVSDHKKD